MSSNQIELRLQHADFLRAALVDRGAGERKGAWYRTLRHRTLLADAAIIVVTMALSFYFRFGDGVDATHSSWVTAVLIGLVWFLALGAVDSRSRTVMGSGLQEYRLVINASLFSFGATAIASFLLQAEISRFYFAMAFPLGLGLLLLTRWWLRLRLGRLRHEGLAMSQTVVVGQRHHVVEALHKLDAQRDAGYSPIAVCIVGDGEDVLPGEWNSLRRVRLQDLGKMPDQGVDAVVLAGGLTGQQMREISWRLENSSAELLLVPGLIDVTGPRIHMRSVETLHLVQVDLPRFSGWNHRVKRTFDVVFSALALLFLAPLLLLIAVAVRRDGGPAVFRQERIGLEGRTFTIHKFRTMSVDAEARKAELQAAGSGNGVLFKVRADPRVTPLGRVLRKYSLDELLQFWTVLRGGMSVVGPRPHLADELDRFPDEGLRRLLIKPGITGLWQVSGRSNLSFAQSIRLDLRYVEDWSLVGDLVIIGKTVKALVHPKGAY